MTVVERVEVAELLCPVTLLEDGLGARWSCGNDASVDDATV